jgi:hypothetical protein
MIKQRTRLVGVCAVTAALAVAGGATTALADRNHPEDGAHHEAAVTASAVKHFEGTVLSKKRHPKRFTIRTEAGQKRKFRVNATTKFERISGFGGLHRGLDVQVDAKRTDRGLVARKVEKRGGGSRGADNTAIDDHGSDGGGGDDGPNHT